MIPAGLDDGDLLGRTALVTSAPYLADGGMPRFLSWPEVGDRVALVRRDGENVVIVTAGADRQTVHPDCLTLAPTQRSVPSPVTPDVAAHVLWHYRQLGYPPGTFTSNLIRAIDSADPGNRALLARAFPAYVRAVRLATEDPGGVDALRRVLETRAPL